LFNLEKWLFGILDLNFVGFCKVLKHVGLGTRLLTLVEEISHGAHIPSYLVNLVGSMRSILGHNNLTFVFLIDESLVILKALHPFIDQRETVVDREELRYVVNDEVETPLENP